MPSESLSRSSALRRTQLHVKYHSGAAAAARFPTDRTSEIVVDERADDLRAQA